MVVSPVWLRTKPEEAVMVPVPVMAGLAPEVVTRVWLMLLVPRASVVPPARESDPPPVALFAPTVIVPAERVVPPVKVAAALSVRLPVPI